MSNIPDMKEWVKSEPSINHSLFTQLHLTADVDLLLGMYVSQGEEGAGLRAGGCRLTQNVQELVRKLG